jgi:hypothetical protein
MGPYVNERGSRRRLRRHSSPRWCSHPLDAVIEYRVSQGPSRCHAPDLPRSAARDVPFGAAYLGTLVSVRCADLCADCVREIGRYGAGNPHREHCEPCLAWTRPTTRSGGSSSICTPTTRSRGNAVQSRWGPSITKPRRCDVSVKRICRWCHGARVERRINVTTSRWSSRSPASTNATGNGESRNDAYAGIPNGR